MGSKAVPVNKIKVDFEIVGREKLSEDAIILYSNLMENGWNKPILLQKGTFKLIDGAHRLEAAKKLGRKKINAVEKDLPDADLRSEAFVQNKKHGVQYTKEERNKLITNLYFWDGKTQQEIADLFGLTRRAIGYILGKNGDSEEEEVGDDEDIDSWVDEENINNGKTSDTDKDKRRKLSSDEQVSIALLAIKGEKQEDIANQFEIKQNRVSQIKTDYIANLRERYSKGEGRLNIAEDTGIDLKKLDELLVTATDKDPLDFELPVTTWWEAYGLDKRQTKHPGAVPVRLVKNLLALFTKPGDHTIDPFAGGGVTKIACEDMIGRTYELFDLRPTQNYINQHSLVNDNNEVFLPEVKQKPNFVFLDPPYGSQKEGDYSTDKRDLSNMNIKEYVKTLENLFHYISEEWGPGEGRSVRIALLMSSQRDKGEINDLPSIFSEVLVSLNYSILDHIVNHVNRPESTNATTIKSAKTYRWLMREHIHIIVAEAR